MPFGMINIRFCYATAGGARVCVYICVDLRVCLCQRYPSGVNEEEWSYDSQAVLDPTG